MKRSLLFTLLLSVSGLSFSSDIAPVKEVPVKTEKTSVTIDDNAVQTPVEDAGWFGKAKSWFSSKLEAARNSYSNAQEKLASIKGTKEEQFYGSLNSAKEKLSFAQEKLQTVKDTAQDQLEDMYSFGVENKSTAAAAAAAGFTTGVVCKYLWDKASTGARVAGTIGLSLAGVMLSDNAQVQAFAEQNTAPLAIAAIAASAGILSRTVYSWSRARSKKEAPESATV